MYNPPHYYAAPPNPVAQNKRFAGRVLSFCQEKGFGKIEMEQTHVLVKNKTVFVHAREVTGRAIQPQDRVIFSLEPTGKNKDGMPLMEAKNVQGGTTPMDKEDGKRMRGQIVSWDCGRGCGRVRDSGKRVLFIHYNRASGQLLELLKSATDAEAVKGTELIFTSRAGGAGAFFAESIEEGCGDAVDDAAREGLAGPKNTAGEHAHETETLRNEVAEMREEVKAMKEAFLKMPLGESKLARSLKKQLEDTRQAAKQPNEEMLQMFKTAFEDQMNHSTKHLESAQRNADNLVNLFTKQGEMVDVQNTLIVAQGDTVRDSAQGSLDALRKLCEQQEELRKMQGTMGTAIASLQCDTNAIRNDSTKNQQSIAALTSLVESVQSLSKLVLYAKTPEHSVTWVSGEGDDDDDEPEVFHEALEEAAGAGGAQGGGSKPSGKRNKNKKK
jgi:cold shock CspA family protein